MLEKWIIRSPLLGACNFILSLYHGTLQTGLFLGFFSREIGQFRSTCARIGKKTMAASGGHVGLIFR